MQLAYSCCPKMQWSAVELWPQYDLLSRAMNAKTRYSFKQLNLGFRLYSESTEWI